MEASERGHVGVVPGFEAALRNIQQYLPLAQRWVIVFEPKYHSRLVRHLLRGLSAPCTLLRLGEDLPTHVQRVAEEHRDDARCVLLEFLVCDGGLTHGGIDYHNALAEYWSWTQSRLRLFFDVTDDNVRVLFSESPRVLERRCLRMRERLNGCKLLSYCGPGGGGISMDCSGAEWHACTGLGPREYTLPSGEVACAPVSVDGDLPVEGWIVGTIPFGIKYGGIRKRGLTISFRAGSIVRISGESLELCSDLEHVLDRTPALRQVVEVGFGQSKAVTQAAKVSDVGCDWHERHLGLHLGLGATLPFDARRPDTGHHLDIVLRRGRVTSTNGHLMLRW